MQWYLFTNCENLHKENTLWNPPYENIHWSCIFLNLYHNWPAWNLPKQRFSPDHKYFACWPNKTIVRAQTMISQYPRPSGLSRLVAFSFCRSFSAFRAFSLSFLRQNFTITHSLSLTQWQASKLSLLTFQFKLSKIWHTFV